MRHKVIRAAAALSGVIAFTALSMVIPSGTAPQAHADDTGSAVTVTKRIIVDGVSKTQTMTLSVSQTKNLAPRQNVSLSWTGAIPSHNYSFVNDGNAPNATEYPVVLMQCWGSDTTGQLDPSHCETSQQLNHYNQMVYDNTNVLDVKNSTNVWNGGDSTRLQLKFQAVNGTWYNMWQSPLSDNSIPSELETGGIPLNARSEWSNTSGARSDIPFEVRTFTDYPASGCSDTQACTLVAVPITNPVCKAGLPATDDCLHGPYTPVGPGNQDVFTSNEYLQATAWWMQTNWRNRISVPLSFVKQNACSVTDQRPSVQLPGSQLASTVMSYYWDPEFCLDPKKFKLQYIQQSEPAAREFLTSKGPGGYADNAILTSLPVTNSPRPVVHAPVLAAGFAISFLIDDKTHAQVTQMRLTPLLLAKLITQSYEAGSHEAVLQGNPVNLFQDPEFLAVNPGFNLAVVGHDRAAGTNLILPYPTQTDTIWALTSYINADPEARAWLNGAPDAYSGMVVNPAFRGYSLPQLATAIKDTTTDAPQYIAPPPHPPSQVGAGLDYACTKGANPPPYFNLMSEGVQGLDDATNAMLNAQNPAQDVCDNGQGSATYGQFEKSPPQIIGNRLLIAVTSTAQAAEYLLPTAQLQVHDINGLRVWSAPTTASMSAALGYTVQDKTSGVLSLDYPHLGPGAYPGTVPVYAAVPTAGLTKSDAKDYSQFLTFAATDGQTPGTSVGNLPPGYAPLPSVLTQYTLEAAQHVAAQDGVVPTPPADEPQQIRDEEHLPPPVNGSGAGSGSGSSGGNGTGTSSPNGGSSPSSGAAGGGANAHGNSPGVTTVAETRGADSWLAAWGLPLLLGIGLLSGVGAPVVRVAAQPGHPVRVFVSTNAGRLAKLFRRGSA